MAVCQIAFLQQELTGARACTFVSKSALAAKTHEGDQLRQNAERLRVDAEQFQTLLGSFCQQTENLAHSLRRAPAELKSSQSAFCLGAASLLENYSHAGTPEYKN